MQNLILNRFDRIPRYAWSIFGFAFWSSLANVFLDYKELEAWLHRSPHWHLSKWLQIDDFLVLKCDLEAHWSILKKRYDGCHGKWTSPRFSSDESRINSREVPAACTRMALPDNIFWTLDLDGSGVVREVLLFGTNNALIFSNSWSVDVSSKSAKGMESLLWCKRYEVRDAWTAARRLRRRGAARYVMLCNAVAAVAVIKHDRK